jgi:hypothetical protein
MKTYLVPFFKIHALSDIPSQIELYYPIYVLLLKIINFHALINNSHYKKARTLKSYFLHTICQNSDMYVSILTFQEVTKTTTSASYGPFLHYYK